MKGITPALVWIHGGGYILGTPEQNDEYCIHLVRATGVTIFSIDYRIAPFPTPLDDCYAALKWVADHNVQQNIDPHRIAVGGESAGGGLAAALAQLAVDRKEVKPIFQLLIYSMLDDRTVVRKDLADRNFLVWNQKSNHFGWTFYLGGECGAADVSPYSVPARRDDLSALPPAWIGVGSLDLFHDENVTYARRLKECGVPCELKVVQGGFHGFDLAGPQVNVVREFRQSQVDALKRFLG
jgi:acetyl esterase/lipase